MRRVEVADTGITSGISWGVLPSLAGTSSCGSTASVASSCSGPYCIMSGVSFSNDEVRFGLCAGDRSSCGNVGAMDGLSTGKYGKGWFRMPVVLQRCAGRATGEILLKKWRLRSVIRLLPSTLTWYCLLGRTSMTHPLFPIVWDDFRFDFVLRLSHQSTKVGEIVCGDHNTLLLRGGALPLLFLRAHGFPSTEAGWAWCARDWVSGI